MFAFIFYFIALFLKQYCIWYFLFRLQYYSNIFVLTLLIFLNIFFFFYTFLCLFIIPILYFLFCNFILTFLLLILYLLFHHFFLKDICVYRSFLFLFPIPTSYNYCKHLCKHVCPTSSAFGEGRGSSAVFVLIFLDRCLWAKLYV